MGVQTDAGLLPAGAVGGARGGLAQVRPSPWLRAPVSDLSDTPSLCLPARPTRGRIVVAKHFRGAGIVVGSLRLRKREGSSKGAPLSRHKWKTLYTHIVFNLI